MVQAELSQKALTLKQTLEHRPPLTEAAAAEYIGMSVGYLRLSRMRGTTKCTSAPPFVRIGKSVRYLPRDLDDWLESRREYPGGQAA
jgi:predicted DNA-binding transcriptional regulator AlpA